MFSNDDAKLIQDNSDDLWNFIDDLHYGVLEEFSLSAIIIIRCHTQYSCDILSCINIEKTPLESGEKQLIFDTLNECIKWHKSSHIHKINENLLKRITPIVKGHNKPSEKVIFLPFLLANESYVAFCFQDDVTLTKIPENLDDRISEIVLLSKKISDTDALINRLKALENYVKEVGHDFASSVQSTIPKLNNISKGRYEGKMIFDKAKEAESEIWSAYRHASNLGLVVDPNYTIKAGELFNFLDIVDSVIRQYESETDERHITITNENCNSKINIWGDQEGIATAISHYLLNALKYSFGSSNIKILVSEINSEVDFKIQNRGVKLHPDESIIIWQCGIRGREAYERHVNGCGIGLYTVKKIIKGHGGHVACRTVDDQTVEFSFRIPKDKSYMKKLL